MCPKNHPASQSTEAIMLPFQGAGLVFLHSNPRRCHWARLYSPFRTYWPAHLLHAVSLPSALADGKKKHKKSPYYIAVIRTS
jgi:hypothetical protein